MLGHRSSKSRESHGALKIGPSHKRGRTRKAKRFTRKLSSLTVIDNTVTRVTRKARDDRVMTRRWQGEEFANSVRENIGASNGSDVRLAEYEQELFANPTFLMVRLKPGESKGGFSWSKSQLIKGAKLYGYRISVSVNSVTGETHVAPVRGTDDWYGIYRASPRAVEYLKTRCGSLEGDFLSEMHERKRALPGTGSGEFMPEDRKPKSKRAKYKPQLPSMPAMCRPGVYVPFGGGENTSTRPVTIDGKSLYIG